MVSLCAEYRRDWNLCCELQNVLGCDIGQYAGDVKYIADDIKIECEGKTDGKCASNLSIPQKNQ
jgi:hypothetical protein